VGFGIALLDGQGIHIRTNGDHWILMTDVTNRSRTSDMKSARGSQQTLSQRRQSRPREPENWALDPHADPDAGA
jgi:hypothetical protein